MRIASVVLLAALAASTGCSNKVSGSVEINGAKEALSSCRNGVVYGYRGVELKLKSGVRLRIAMTQTGESSLVMMPAGSDVGTTIGACGAFSVSDQNSEINGVKNVEGHAELDCATDGFTIKGSVKFENCH